jgi:glycosyltransferase involved in cell wall biosynthesis
MRILGFMPHSRGGIADYAHDQANALQDIGVEVELLCAPGYVEGRRARYRLRPELAECFPKQQSPVRVLRRLRLSQRILQSAGRLVGAVEQGRHEFVLMHFSEYLAPLWAPPLQRLKARGVTFGSVLHDPVRNYVVGPKVWHDWSVRQAFSFLNCVFVHSGHELKNRGGVASTVVPYGVHSFPPPKKDRASLRRSLDIPQEAKVLLSFGFIRDNKNLDLVLEALSGIRELYLVIAGSDQSGGNRPASYYVARAEQLGCADRCRWLIRYIDDTEMADLHAASDLSVLTYSRSFRSASSALSATTNYRIPCIASSGPGPLEDLVKRYKLGIWVEPDSAEAIMAGLRHWFDVGVVPDWERYYSENSWGENARRVVDAMLRSRELKT